MYTDLKHIAPLVQHQFPAFYQEEGENFLQFIKAYYEWMDTEGPLGKSRRLGEYRDIDETLDEYLDHFMSKYMHGIPKNILTDKRLLEKHILDLYRSKGTSEGIKLLFRILYQKDISIYTPQVDMLKTSDGNWVRRKYMEVLPTNPTNHFSYLNKYITGSNSGASAYVDESIEFYIGNQLVNILYLTDIGVGSNGDEFLIGDYLIYDGLTITDASYVLGSAVSATISSSSPDNAVDDILEIETNTGRGIKFAVSKILDSNASKGYLVFKLKYGGHGYLLNSHVNLSYKTATTGSGASFRIKSIINPITIKHNDTPISSYTEMLISEPDYGPDFDNGNIDSIIGESLTFTDLVIGSIGGLRAITSGDRQYDGSLFVNVNEPSITGYGWRDSDGNLWGNNAIVTADLATPNGTVDQVRLVSSGYGFNTDKETLLFINTRNTDSEVELELNTSAVGMEEGYWKDTAGFLNSNKYIQDSYYYQEYSYEIQVEKSLDKYVDVVKKTMHPLGNKLFGRPLVIDDDNTLIVRLQIDSFENFEADRIYDIIRTDIPPYYVEVVWDDNGPYWRYLSNNAIYVL